LKEIDGHRRKSGVNISPTRRVTAMDVAKAAGVSRTTVSYVLNESPHQSIPESTRRRVLDAAARLGYAPFSAARMLATGRSNLVLGVIPDWPVGPNLGALLRRLTEAFAEHGLVYLSHTATWPEPDLVPLWRTVSPAAVLIFDDVSTEQLERMRAAGIPVVVALLSRSGRGMGEVEMWEKQVGPLQASHLVGPVPPRRSTRRSA
jgi:DNA-binding LacI/PurR family transcriptional regulator